MRNDPSYNFLNSRVAAYLPRSAPLFLLAFIFTTLALIQLGLVNNNLSFSSTVLPVIVWGICGVGTAYLLHRNYRQVDPILLPLIFLLTGLGLAFITRLAPPFVLRQLAWLVVATLLLLGVTLLPRNLQWLRRYKYTWFSSGLLLLAVTLIFGVNPSGFGARLWLPLGGFAFFQPSEPLKLLLVIFLAAYMADRRRQLIEARAYIGSLAIPHPSYWFPMLAMWGFSIILLVWQRDLGAATLFFSTFVAMLYATTGQSRYVWGGLILLMMAGVLGYNLFEVVRLRVDSFWNPWLDADGRSFQIVQSLLAFASGSLLGQGLGQGLPTAIPVVHTDFVYAAIGEEYGLLGALGILVCFILLVSRAFYIGIRAKTGFEQLLAVGIGTILGLQTLVITAGTLKLMPLTGVTLPFVSYGGSSLVSSFLMIGLLLFISNQASEAVLEDTPLVAQRPAFFKPYLRLARGLFVGFAIVAGGLIFWQILLGPFLLERGDNPRPIIEEQRSRRGRLLTADGIPVAETILDEDGLADRHYPYPGLSSVTGYYSLRYGVGGTEDAFDPILRGTATQTAEQARLDALLHRPLQGQDVTLTIDLPAQVAADVALGDQEGAVVLMEIESGAILVMSSHPTYDPNQLDEIWDQLRDDERAPLINRTTQGLFPLGDLARFVGLVGLFEVDATLPLDPATAPLAPMLAPLGEQGYRATAYQLGLFRALSGFPSQAGLLPPFAEKGTVRDLTVTPLHVARMVASLETEGQLPTPILSLITESSQTPGIKPETAEQVRSFLTAIDEQTIGLTGVATPEETGQQFLSWFVGLAPTLPSAPFERQGADEIRFDPDEMEALATPTVTNADRPAPARYIVVAVVVTEQPDPDQAYRIGRAPLQVVLERP
ncbi:MAG: FtsW/RodA/SpoVE family cell cycle protein [Chloroflexota bacterium]